MKSTAKLILAGMLTATSALVNAQTVVTPPRAMTSQQETPGVDSTFQDDVVPNTQTSTYQMTVTGSGGAPAPAPAPAPTPAPAPAPSPSPTKKYGACMVVSPNGPDVSNVLYDLATNHIVETAFDSSITLTSAELAETVTGQGNCTDGVLIYYGSYASANALAAGMPSSDYLTEWLTYPDPTYPHGPVW